MDNGNKCNGANPQEIQISEKIENEKAVQPSSLAGATIETLVSVGELVAAGGSLIESIFGD